MAAAAAACGCWQLLVVSPVCVHTHLQKGPSAAQRVSLLAALQGSCAGTQLLSLRQPLLRLAVDAQSAGLSLFRQHLSAAWQGVAAAARGLAALMGSADAAPAAVAAACLDESSVNAGGRAAEVWQSSSMRLVGEVCCTSATAKRLMAVPGGWVAT